MTTAHVDLARLPADPAVLGEGPCWDPASGTLYWVDIPSHLVHALDSGGLHLSWDAGQEVSALVPRAGGGLVLAARSGFLTLNPRTAAITPLAEFDLGAGIRMNDGACDQAGRFLAGTMADDESPGAGTLYRLDADHKVRAVLSGVSISNGIDWSPDGSQMYYVDSPTGQVDVLDYDQRTGDMSGRRVFAPIDAGNAVPDGLTVDAEGCVWVALWEGGALLRFGPDGRLRSSLQLPARRVTSCAFGGPDLGTLYITTARDPAGDGGAVFSCQPGVTGQPARPYQG